MVTITIKKIDHPVFKDRQEFEQYFLVKTGVIPKLVENWMDGKEGDWVLADDGGVCQLLRNKDKLPHPGYHPDRPYAKGWCRTAVGTFPKVKNCFMDTDTTWRDYTMRYQFVYRSKVTGKITTGICTDKRKKSIYMREKMTKKELKFWLLCLSRLDPVDAYMKVFKNTNRRNATTLAYILLSQKRFQEVMTKETESAAKELKIDPKYILGNYKSLYKDSENEQFKFKVNDRLAEIIEVKPTDQLPHKEVAAGFMQLSTTQLDEKDYEGIPVLTEAKEVKDKNGKPKSP